jgi:hypothetical protein
VTIVHQVTSSEKKHVLQQNSTQKIMTCLCKCCSGISIKEKLIRDEKTTLDHRIPDEFDDSQTYTRIVFGIDPLYIDDKIPCAVPEGQATVHFCRDCEEKYQVFNSLIEVVRKASGEKFQEGLGQSEFIQGKGHWITADRYNSRQADGYFNIQIDYRTFEEVLKDLTHFFGNQNPFGIKKL